MCRFDSVGFGRESVVEWVDTEYSRLVYPILELLGVRIHLEGLPSYGEMQSFTCIVPKNGVFGPPPTSGRF